MGLPPAGARVQVARWEADTHTPNEALLPMLAACLGYWPIKGSTDLRREIVQRALAGAIDD